MPAVGYNILKAKLSDTWKVWNKFWAKHDGVWKRPLSVFVKSGGNWVEIWDESPVWTYVSTYHTDNGSTWTRAHKLIGADSNGFASTITATATDYFYPNPTVVLNKASLAVDEFDNFILAYAEYPYNYQGAFPMITITNASGSTTV